MTSLERGDPYVVLGVPREASDEEIARAYRRAARVSHPDGGEAGSAERFRAVSDAYEVLRDPGRRAVYDRSHLLARSRTPDVWGESVRYASPGSQHVLLGRAASRAAPQPRVSASDIGDVPSARQRRDLEEIFRLALSLLRSSW
jgi:curved DNA-binding protein CbpA